MNTNPFRFTFFLACVAIAALLVQPALGAAAARPSPAQAIRKAMTSDPLTQTELKYQLQIIDAQAFGPTINGTLNGTLSPSEALPWQTLQAEYRYGSLADGLSVLVIRLITPFPSGQPSPAAAVLAQPVTFQITDENSDPPSVIGSISATMPTLPAPVGGAAGVAGAKPQFSITIPAGQPAVVYYCPPDQWKLFHDSFSYDFDLTELQNRQITVDASTAAKDLANFPLDVVRPQIVLVHGVASGPGTWSTFTKTINWLPLTQLVAADYSGSNTSGYAFNGYVVRDEIAALVKKDRSPGAGIPPIAATRLDVVGHSMGGVLTAWYAADLGNITLYRGDGFPNASWNGADGPYSRANDFGVGDIRRFISIGSPFQGSPIATWIVGHVPYGVIQTLLGAFGWAGDYCAIWDLSTNLSTNAGKSATGYIAQVHVAGLEWFPIAGAAGTSTLVGPPWNEIMSHLGVPPSIPALTPTNSDLIVSEVSAEDGSPPNLKYWVAPNAVHTAETDNAGIENKVEGALDLTAAGGSPDFNTAFP